MRTNRHWPHRGGTFEAMMTAEPETLAVSEPGDEEVIARVEAVSICSSDIKIMRMGPEHPLFAGAKGAIDTVLGHEACLRVVTVGAAQAGRFHPGQRLGLQPAMVIDGARSIIGMDRPGAFAQYLRLGPEALSGHVFDVPETVSAAAIALLEPYGCVEKSWRPNVRGQLLPGGRALVVSAPGADFSLADVPEWREITVVGDVPDFLRPRAVTRADGLDGLSGRFDDILALGDLGAAHLERLAGLLATGGVLLQGRTGPSPGPVSIDPARLHYDGLSFLGTSSRDLDAALSPDAQRFDVRPGGVALVHGAGGAMGRIHVHRLLQLPEGPRTVIATSRKGQRIDDILRDFKAIADANGRRLIAAGAEDLAGILKEHAPAGVDDAMIVAPSAAAIAQATGLLAPDGLLSLFAGFPYGQGVAVDLAAVALTGMRFTGSTGCSVEDMRNVLSRVEAGTLDLSANIAAVAGLDTLPKALMAVSEGTVSGKIVVYPQVPDLPLTPVAGWSAEDEHGLTGGG
ncbi:alcohol dehydrogenase catalytic domain-containing protein [Ciceribacter sp. sgz301302]